MANLFGRPPKFSNKMVKLEAELYLRGLSYIEIAQRLDIPKSTVAFHMARRLVEVDSQLYCKVRCRARNRNRLLKFKEEVI
jgi:DNA-binding NarL/FixJ family response regulator